MDIRNFLPNIRFFRYPSRSLDNNHCIHQVQNSFHFQNMNLCSARSIIHMCHSHLRTSSADIYPGKTFRLLRFYTPNIYQNPASNRRELLVNKTCSNVTKLHSDHFVYFSDRTARSVSLPEIYLLFHDTTTRTIKAAKYI